MACPHCTIGARPDHLIVMDATTIKWVTSNPGSRSHWRWNASTKAQWRKTAAQMANTLRIPNLDRIHIVCVLHFADSRRRDPNNWAPTAKAIVDGLVDAGVVDDDSAQYVIGPDMRLGPIQALPSIDVQIWRLP